eukprot:jgi/Hompol1/4131/HPOL_003477-RA
MSSIVLAAPSSVYDLRDRVKEAASEVQPLVNDMSERVNSIISENSG